MARVLCMRLFFGLALPGSLYRHPMKGAVLGDDHVVVIARPHESVLSRLEDLLQTMFFFFVRHVSTTRLAEAAFPQAKRAPGLRVLPGAQEPRGGEDQRTVRFFMGAPVPLPVVEVSLGSCQRRAGAPHLKRSRMQL